MSRRVTMPIVLYEVCQASAGARAVEPLAFRYEGGPLDLAALRRLFPESGQFHFRARVTHPWEQGGWAWQDLVADSEPVPRAPDGGPPYVRALPVMFEEENDAGRRAAAGEEPARSSNYDLGDFEPATPPQQLQQADLDLFSEPRAARSPSPVRAEPSSLESSSSESDSDDDRPLREARTSRDALEPPEPPQQRESPPPPPLQQQQQQQQQQQPPQATAAPSWSSVSSFLKKSAQAASQAAAQLAAQSGLAPGMANAQQRAALNSLARLQTERCDASEHSLQLKACWKAAFPDAAFQASGPQWQLLGFQGDDPCRDAVLSKTGALGLRCLAYYLEHTFGRQRGISTSALQLAPAVATAVLRLSAHLELATHGFESANRPYWALFDQPGGFFEVVAVAVGLADGQARAGKTDADKAPRIAIDRVLALLQSHAPKNVDELYQAVRSSER